MAHETGSTSAMARFPIPPLTEQADLAEKHGIDTLLYCPDPWTLCHVFINQDTGEVVRARCNRWDCLYCGLRKVDQWRQLVTAAEPVLFITLTKAGKTVEEVARAMTTFLQYLRRGSKGRGPNHIGARLAYLIEYFAVLERHSDFEENGFHWHLLVKGVDFIPHDILKEAWRSARHGEAYIVDVQAIRKPHVIGYVTKYLTKSLSRGERVCDKRKGKRRSSAWMMRARLLRNSIPIRLNSPVKRGVFATHIISSPKKLRCYEQGCLLKLMSNLWNRQKRSHLMRNHLWILWF